MNRRMAACATLLLILFSASAAAGTASANSPGANITPANALTVPGANITPASNLSASTPSANSPSTNASFPVKAITAVEGNVQSTSVWFAPPPVEKPVLGWIQDGRSRTGPTGIIVKGTVLAGVASGLALSVKGISVLFTGAGDNFDSKAMHSGLLMAVSGSLVSSLFSVLLTSIK